MRWLGILSAVAVLSASVGSGPGQAVPPVLRYEPVESVLVEPCCVPAATAAASERLGPRGGRTWEPPEGEFLPERQMQRLRETNRWRPDVPAADRTRRAVRAAAATAPRLRQKITGLDQVDSYAESPSFFWALKPPDTVGAASADTILQATNSAMLLMDRGGASRRMQRANDHFGVEVDDDGKGILFDPKVRYDAESGRYFVVYLYQTKKPKKSFIYLSVSRGEPSSLTSGWCNYKIKGKIGGSWADYEGVGFNRDLFVLTSNNFTFSDSYKTALAWVADKQALVDNGSGCPKVKFDRFDLGQVFTVRPAQHLDGSSPDALYMAVSTCCSASTRAFGLYRVTNSARGAGSPQASIELVVLNGDEYGTPPKSPQKNSASELETGDARLTQAVFRDGILYATHATVCKIGPPPNESCVRTVEVAVSEPLSASKIVGQATLGAGKGRYVWWPGITVNAAGDVVSVAQYAGKKRYLSTAYAVRSGSARASGAAGFSKYKILAKGVRESLCGSARNRTGDYTMAAVAPDGATFLIAGQFADRKGKVDSFDEDCAWSTRVGVLR